MTVLIQNNSITAMTGGQTHPGAERTLAGIETKPVDLMGICRALGVEHVVEVDPYDSKASLAALKEALAFPGPAVVITNRPCMLFPRKVEGTGAFVVDAELCTACQRCMTLGCPSLRHTDVRVKTGRKVETDVASCSGCSLCAQLCAAGAISRAETTEAGARWSGATGVDNVMVAGVGGQGVIVAAAIIADTALLHGGLEVKLIETRGMSQRGGSVQSQIRIGERVIAPVISPGEVDYLLAFEAAEALRLAPSLAPDGKAIVNTTQIVPPLGLDRYARVSVQRCRTSARVGPA